MDRYHLLRNRIYWGGMAGVFLIGLLTADTYLPEVMGPAGGAAATLSDIFNGMVYDSTFLLIFISSLLALVFSREFSWRTISQEVSAGHCREMIFISKLISYLPAFNLMAIVYPAAGCVREYMRFGIADPGIFFYNVIRAVLYSFLQNSAMLLTAVFFCCCFRNTAKAVAFTAAVTFVLSLYLGYGMMLGLPVAFLPTYQVRAAVSSQGMFRPGNFAVAFIWWGILIALSWRQFRRCDLK